MKIKKIAEIPAPALDVKEIHSYDGHRIKTGICVYKDRRCYFVIHRMGEVNIAYIYLLP